MLKRELTYRMPFERLMKLSRSAGRKAFSASWYATWLLVGGYFALLGALVYFDDEIARLDHEAGIPWWLWLVLLMAATFAGLFLVRRAGRRALRSRVDFDSMVTLNQVTDGLRFATPQIEYFLRWNGIGQMMIEHDGVVVAHGSLFFLIPDAAFAGKDERDDFIRDVFGRLGQDARERSERFVRPLLDQAESTPRS